MPGDVVQLSTGSLIPADGRILTARDCFANQAVLTGETFPAEKQPGVVAANAALTDRSNCIFMGTNARSGSATAVIVQTGAATTFGQIADRLTVRPPETEFERGIRHLGCLLTEVMLLLVLGIFAFNVFLQKPVLDSLLFSLALAVGLTPQLLPAIININLSKGSQAMAKEGVIVRRLASIEDFGSMDVLCTDKTGTLTLGVVKKWPRSRPIRCATKPPKDGVAETIADLAELGVGLKIITGDNKLAAQHTAVTIGLAVTGADLDATGPDALPQMVEKPISSPKSTPTRRKASSWPCKKWATSLATWAMASTTPPRCTPPT